MIKIPRSQIEACLYKLIADKEKEYGYNPDPEIKKQWVEKLVYSKYYEVIEDQ